MAYVRNPVVYVPDLTNGRPIVDGKVYLLTSGTIPPMHDSTIDPLDLLTVTFVNEAGNTVEQPQPLYTSKGGCLYGNFPEEAAQYIVSNNSYVFAAYNSNGVLQYSASTSGTDSVETADLAATDSTVLIAGKQASSVGFGGDAYNRYKTTVNFSLPDEDADGLRSAMANANKTNQTTYGRFKYINGTASTTGVFDVANFAGQALGSSASIGFVFHHYTDGAMIQVDNVGEANNIITLKNAHNPTRRSDKAADFVGSGTYIRFDKHNYSLGYSQTLGFVDKDFKIVWTGVAGIATLWQNRADDGTAAFRLQTTNAHVNILDVLNGISNQRSFSIRDDVSFTRTILRTETNRANGIGLEAMDGDVWLLSNGDTTKRIKVNKPITATSGNTTLTAITNQSVESQVPFLLRGYNTSGLPSASAYNGAMIRVLDRASKPAYSDGTNWLFVSNDTIVS